MSCLREGEERHQRVTEEGGEVARAGSGQAGNTQGDIQALSCLIASARMIR